MNLNTLTLPHSIFLIAAIVYLAMRLSLTWRITRSRQKSIDHGNALDEALVYLMAVAQVGLPAMAILTDWLDAADVGLPTLATVPGAIVMALGLWLFTRSHLDLGINWSITTTLRRDHVLVTHGVYRYLRHPMYAAFFLMAIGQALLVDNLIGGWSALVSTTLLYLVRVPREERMMIEYFGEAYRLYKRHTGGLVPRW